MAIRPFRRSVRNYLPELVYGANDGIVTTLAVIAGVTGAQLSTRLILILGFANLLADGISTGASNILSQRSKIDDRPTLRKAMPKGIATCTGFVLAWFIPLLGNLSPSSDETRLVIAAALAALTLFPVGTGRSLVAERAWFPAGLETLLIGMAAFSVAYGGGVFGALLTGNGG